MSDNITDDQMLTLEASYMELTSRLAEDGYPPLASAAIMIKLAMMVYKTSLSAEDYNSMVDQISNSRDMFKSFNEYALMGRLN